MLVVELPLFGKRPLVKLLENPLLMAVVLTAGGRALLVVELPLFGKKPPLMVVVLATGGIAMFVVETPMLWKKPPLMAVLLAAGGRAVVAAETPLVKLAVTPLLTACSSLLRSFFTRATGIDFC